MPASIPSKTGGSLGAVLTDARTPVINELSAIHVERFKDQHIATAVELGLLDGSTAGSVWERLLHLSSSGVVTGDATSAPSAVSGKAFLYAKTVSGTTAFYTKDSAGTEVNLSAPQCTASICTFTPAGTISSTNVQDALVEVATEAASALSTHAANTSNPHSVTAAQVGAVPTSRTLQGSGAIQIAGGSSAVDLSTNRVISIIAADASNAGTMSAADFTKLAGVAASAAAVATSGTPAAIGTAALGVAATAARSDHVHAHGTQLGGSLHAVATQVADGFLSAADKARLDGLVSAVVVPTTFGPSAGPHNLTTAYSFIALDNSTNDLTIQLPDPATVAGRYWQIYIKTRTQRLCTFVRHGSEKINDLAASKVLRAPQGTWTLTCDGVDWVFTGKNQAWEVFGSSGSWVGPAGVNSAEIYAIPGAGGGKGGGGGGAGNTTNGGGGGGSGAGGAGCGLPLCPVSTEIVPGTSYTVTIGAGGTGGTGGTGGVAGGAAATAPTGGTSGASTRFTDGSTVDFRFARTAAFLGGDTPTNQPGFGGAAGGSGGTAGSAGASSGANVYPHILNPTSTAGGAGGAGGTGAAAGSGGGGGSSQNIGMAGFFLNSPQANSVGANGGTTDGVRGGGGGGANGGVGGLGIECLPVGLISAGFTLPTTSHGAAGGGSGTSKGGNAATGTGQAGGTGNNGSNGYLGRGGGGGAGGGGGGAGSVTGGNGGGGGNGGNGSDGLLIISWLE